MKKIFLNIVMLLSMFSINNFLYAQSECPPDNGNPWSDGTGSYHISNYGYMGTVAYKYRDNGSGDKEVVIDWTTLNNTSQFISDEILKIMLEQDIVKSFMEHTNLALTNVAVYHSKECKVDQSIVYNLTVSQEFDCCDVGGGQATNDWFKWLSEGNTVTNRLYKETKQVTCGHKCCKRSYYIRSYYDNVYFRWSAEIESVLVTTISDCDCTTTYYDCSTGNVVPCTGDCD